MTAIEHNDFCKENKYDNWYRFALSKDYCGADNAGETTKSTYKELQEEDSAEQESIFVEGHDSGNYFWIMLVRVISKDQERDAEVEEHIPEQISIEAGYVRSMLYYFLNQFYDPSLQEPFRNTQLYGLKFDWDLEHNVYTYASVRKMIERIREYARLLQTDYGNPVLDELKAGFRPGLFDSEYDFYEERPDKEAVIQKNIYVAIEFYEHFCDRMEVMLKNAPQFEVISFMGRNI